MPAQDLESLLRAISTAIREALEAVDEHSVRSFMTHFETAPGAAGEGSMVPRMVSVPLPRPDGTWSTRKVPEVALMHHHALHIEEIRMKFRVTMSEGEESKGVMVELSRPAEPSAAQAPGSAEVEVLFRRGDPPEGIARVSGEYYKTL